MTRRRVSLALLGTALAASVLATSALLLPGATAGAEESGGDDEVTLRFDAVLSPFSYTDLGQPGPSPADVVVFSDRLLQEGREVGHEVGSCVVVDPSGLANCTAVVTLDGRGTLTYAFENAPPPEKTLAVTGGSGDHRGARGDGTFVEHGDGTGTLTLTLVGR
ncbi:hypothetical protein ACI79C_08045 [Geodermatophilus sp. SYSU D00697]